MYRRKASLSPVRGMCAALPALLVVLSASFGSAVFPAMAAEGPIQGGTLIYLEHQAHTNLYSPSGGFYPNGGILNQITDRLTWQDPVSLEMKPWVATSWEINADYTQFTFHIRPGITFSDGSKLDAAVVAENFDIFARGSKARRLPVSEVVNNYARSEVIDPLTVRFDFNTPSPGFLQGTSVIGSGLLSHATLQRSFDELGLGTHIIGSGPFVIADEIVGKEVDLAARPDYRWGPDGATRRAWLDRVRILVTPEDSIRLGALLAGQADFIRDVAAYDEEQVRLRGYMLYAPSTRGVNNALAFRPDNPLVADRRVRAALLHATNREEIVTALFSGNYPLARSVIATKAAGFEDLSRQLAFDPALAAHLLDEAGWHLADDGLRYKDNQPLALGIHFALPQPQNRTMLELIAQQWRRVGVQLNVMSGSTAGVIIDNLDPARTPLMMAEVGRADPDVLKSEFYPSNRDILLQKGGQSTKVQSFADARLNALLQAISADVNPQDRLRKTQEAQEYILDACYVIPILEEPQVYAGAPAVHGVSFEAVGRPNFYDMWLGAR
ncbi:TIGR04028 family ABC transporter substrate-binding protein [Gluconacetobacter asukensis]|nr:TIGR04028 family ABC transporter substrate-binding protein [Gluconacetobacter asukensis]